jgi:hypothetical protein
MNERSDWLLRFAVDLIEPALRGVKLITGAVKSGTDTLDARALLSRCSATWSRCSGKPSRRERLPFRALVCPCVPVELRLAQACPVAHSRLARASLADPDLPTACRTRRPFAFAGLPAPVNILATTDRRRPKADGGSEARNGLGKGDCNSARVMHRTLWVGVTLAPHTRPARVGFVPILRRMQARRPRTGRP